MSEAKEDKTLLQYELEAMLNRHSRENASDTPDFILAEFMMGCLVTFERTVRARETWYGRDARAVGGDGPAPVDREPMAGG